MARQLITLNTQAVVATEERNDNLDRYLTIVVGEEIYGLSILKVREIDEYCELTPIPMMPDFIRGALNLRGQVVPVIDLAQRLGRETTEVQRRTCIVIVELVLHGQGTMEAGLIVDAVSQVIKINAEDIKPAPSFGGAIHTDFIHGVGKHDDQFVILLDIDRVLSMDDLALLDQARDLGEAGQDEEGETS